MADWELLDRAREGDGKAWTVLFQKHSPSLLKISALVAGSTEAAKDLVQDTFLRAISGVTHHRRGSLKTYLSTIAFRLALKEESRTRRNGKLGNMAISDPVSSVLEQLVEDEEQSGVLRVLQELPSHHREILTLRFHGEHTYEEIASITGLSIGTVKSRLFYAVKQSRRALKKKGIL